MNILQFSTETEDQIRRRRYLRHVRNSRVASGYTVRNEARRFFTGSMICWLIVAVAFAVLSYLLK